MTSAQIMWNNYKNTNSVLTGSRAFDTTKPDSTLGVFGEFLIGLRVLLSLQLGV